MSEHAIGHVRPPVQKLVDTLILFSRPPQGKTKCKQVSSLVIAESSFAFGGRRAFLS
ncbi:MAG: hypothetical protein IJK63_11880 [Oscillospiraceae bacterium]|nr:hypothetical protein [Oscillospiraceae bacterium]